ncbi:MAG: ADP-ribosylglycohydrolase family protein [Ruminococcaceae bacterium]|nr:ADP-ribosylglycohydrolase family protein [Oscillospiraceae bacterium]
MFGAIYGDVIGSYYEVHCTKNYDFEFDNDSSFTDDSVLIAAVCKAILNNPAEISKWNIRKRAKEYAVQYRQYYSYHPYAGFGNMFADWAKNPYARNGHSYANGASMRVIPIGYAYKTLEQTLLQAKASCLSTHNHREAIKGAQAVAAAIFLARNGKTKDHIKAYVENTFRYDLSTPISVIKESHVFDSRTSYSVPPAIIAFLESSDYESAIRLAISLGGDADTQACIAGGIAEAYYKTIPDHIKRFCDGRIDNSIKTVVKEFNNEYLLS